MGFVHMPVPPTFLCQALPVMAPVSIKVITAASDRNESRANPHTPCPEVHPEPRDVPTPTRRPAESARAVVMVLGMGPASDAGRSCVRIAPPLINPPMNDTRQLSMLPTLRKRPPTMPEMPAMRPVVPSLNAAVFVCEGVDVVECRGA